MLDGEKILAIGVLVALFGLISPMWISGQIIPTLMIIIGIAMIGYDLYFGDEK